MSGQTARNIWGDRGRPRQQTAKSIADEIKSQLPGLGETRERIRLLEQQVANASATEMKLRRKIRDLKGELAVTEVRENLLPKSQPNSIDNDPKGYFGILGLHPNAFGDLNDGQIKELLARIFRFYSHIHHPDKGGDIEKMRLLNEAHDFFIDPRNRAEYGKS